MFLLHLPRVRPSVPRCLRRALAIALTCCVALTSWGGAYAPCDDGGPGPMPVAHASMDETAEMPGMPHHGATSSDDPCQQASHSSGHQDASDGTCKLGLHCAMTTMVVDVPLSFDAPPCSDAPVAQPASVLRTHTTQPEAPPPKA